MPVYLEISRGSESSAGKTIQVTRRPSVVLSPVRLDSRRDVSELVSWSCKYAGPIYRNGIMLSNSSCWVKPLQANVAATSELV